MKVNLDKILKGDSRLVKLQDKMWKLQTDRAKLISYNITFFLTVLPGLTILLQKIYHQEFVEAQTNMKQQDRTYLKDVGMAILNLIIFIFFGFRKSIFMNQPIKPAIIGSCLSLIFIILSKRNIPFIKYMKSFGNKITRNYTAQYLFLIIFFMAIGLTLFNSVLYGFYRSKIYDIW